MDEIVLCKCCKQPEYYGRMMWLSGRCMCRECYKDEYKRETKKAYVWDDLDWPVPTMEEYENATNSLL